PMREIAVARELTKHHEETRRGTARSLIAHYEMHPPKGEIVVMAGPCQTEAEPDPVDLAAMVAAEMANGASHRDAARNVAQATGLPRSRIYAISLNAQSSDP
ncbi:MAG: 16S rRNA (cytidine(1402)-2'-O)-methyltransferase, partial [Alphaproteobacteria bacterium]|nr:16S rRNA (cytidine(1402)-2'-O)-methyltransferase [Alphaproteobacteria bacterium]